MADFMPAMALAELPMGTCREVAVGGRNVALFNVDGQIYATANTCLHRGGPLGQGILSGATVYCPWHAWAFDVRSGVCPDDSALKLETYEVRIEDGRVLVKV